ncbi:MAG: P-loop NTPase [Clostridia bacterium]|nr:P-loop NTPase [Clostridia bacterium]
MKLIGQLKLSFDHVLIDCPAGIERGLRGLLNKHTDETILISTPDDVCIRNVERTASVLQGKDMPSPRLVVNMLDSELIDAGEMYSAAVVSQTLDLPLLGEVPRDPVVYRSLINHKPLMQCDCEARYALTRIAARMEGMDEPFPAYGVRKPGFFSRLFGRKHKEVNKL